MKQRNTNGERDNEKKSINILHIINDYDYDYHYNYNQLSIIDNLENNSIK